VTAPKRPSPVAPSACLNLAADTLVGGNPAGIAIAIGCFAVVVTAIAYGIYIIVLSGLK
jgi:hypothetical protein